MGNHMFNNIIPFDIRLSLREKVKLNIGIAQDLADSFGGRKADYLIPLNKKLKMKIAVKTSGEVNAQVLAA
jgi:hypothetical protein